MTDGAQLPGGVPCWVELSTGDVAGALDFYQGLFGWRAMPLSEEFGRYLVLFNGDEPVGACNQYQSSLGQGWCVFLTSHDLGRALEVAHGAGARLLAPAFALSHLGLTALIEDPAGASVGLWQPGSFAGFSYSRLPGGPVFFDLVTSDWAGEAGFYDAVFGLVAKVAGRVTAGYAQLFAGERRVADMRSPEGPPQPACWLPHFAVQGLRSTMTRAVRLGGEVLGPICERRGGRLVEVADPAGARFHLSSMQP